MRNEECYGCEFYDECEDQDYLCTGCKHEDDCPLQSVMCMCKRGFILNVTMVMRTKMIGLMMKTKRRKTKNESK